MSSNMPTGSGAEPQISNPATPQNPAMPPQGPPGPPDTWYLGPDGARHEGTIPPFTAPPVTPPVVEETSTDTNPGPYCNTCQHNDPTGFLCNHPSCAFTATQTWYDGSTQKSQMVLSMARSESGPCGPSGSLYVAK